MQLHDLDKPPREPRDVIQDALDKGTVYLVWLDTSEVRACYSREQVIAGIAAGEYCDPLKVVRLWGGRYGDASENIARSVHDLMPEHDDEVPRLHMANYFARRPR